MGGFEACNGNLAVSEVEIEWLQKICAGFHNDVAARDTDISRTVLDVCRYVNGFDQDCAEAPIIGIEDEFPGRGKIVGKTNAGPTKQVQRRFKKSSFAKRNHKHSFTALPSRRSWRAFSNPLSPSTEVVSISVIGIVGVTICSRRSRLKEKPTAGRSSRS